MTSFRRKSRTTGLVSKMTVYVIQNPKVALSDVACYDKKVSVDDMMTVMGR